MTAIAFAAAKGWLSLGGVPSHSVLLTPQQPERFLERLRTVAPSE